MYEFWHRFLTNLRWFLGTIIVLFILSVFFWRIFDPQGFILNVNNFFSSMWEIIKSILALALAIFAIRIMFGYRPWWMGKGNKGAH